MNSVYRFVVRGRVQGVFFRQSAATTARSLGLTGWVRNCTDGSVEGIAQGPAPALAMLRQWLDRGPPAAKVEAVEWTPSQESAGADFEVCR